MRENKSDGTARLGTSEMRVRNKRFISAKRDRVVRPKILASPRRIRYATFGAMSYFERRPQKKIGIPIFGYFAISNYLSLLIERKGLRRGRTRRKIESSVYDAFRFGRGGAIVMYEIMPSPPGNLAPIPVSIVSRRSNFRPSSQHTEY